MNRHRQEGRAFLYIPCVAEQEAGRSEMRHMMQRFFGNSRERLLLSLLGDDERRSGGAATLERGDCSGGGQPRGRRPMMPAALAAAVLLGPGAESISRLVANSFVAGLWQGVVLAAGVGICLHLVPRTTAAVRFAVWTAVFAVLAVLPLVHAYGQRAGAGVAGHGSVLQVDLRWSFAIAAVWLVVSLVRAVKLAMSGARLLRIWKRAVPVAGCDEVLSAAGIRRATICTSKDVDRPSVIGFLSPRILIPEDLFARLTTAEFGLIVLHEMGHLWRSR